MKKLLLAAICVAVMVLTLPFGLVDVWAQRGPNRLPGGFGRPKRPLDPQIGGRNGGGQPNPNRAKQLQRKRQELIQTLGLTSDQRTRMTDIKRNLDDEQIEIGRHIRQTRNALDRAIMSPNYNEILVRRLTEELATAHADQIRFQSRLRVQLRNVLTPDQVTRLRQLEVELRRQNREETKDLDKPGAERESIPPAQSRPPNEPDIDLESLLIFNR